MGPCAVCGSLTINATGHCAHCGTYRGLPGQPPPAQPGYPVPAGPAGPGYPAPGVPPGYPPQGGGPVYPGGGPGYPGSGGPGYPGSGGGQVGYPQPAPSSRKPFLIPLIALASTLVVLMVAIVVVLIGRNDDPGTGRTAGPANPTGSTRPATGDGPVQSTQPTVDDDPTSDSPDIDSCVVGTWRVVRHREEVNNEDLGGKLVFTGGQGATMRLNADGSGESDYGSGTAYTAVAGGRSIKLEVLGEITFTYRAIDGKLTVSDVRSNATFKFYINNEQYGDTQGFEASDAPSSYTCVGDSMTQKTLLYTIEYERIG